MDEEEYAPLVQLHRLDYLPVHSLAQEIGDLIYDFVDTPFKYEQLKSPQLYNLLVRPVVDKIRKEYLNGAIFYCLLANRIHFEKEVGDDLANSKLWRTRAMICEVVAIKLLSEFKIDEIAQNLSFEFYPLSDGLVTTTSIVPNFLRISTFELAIYSEAKQFLSQPVIVSIISELWEGTLVFDPLIYKAHHLGLRSQEELTNIIQTNRGLLVRYDLEVDTKFKLSRLRVPKYRNVLKFMSVLVLVALYVGNLQDFDERYSVKEYIFLAWSMAFAIDEFVSLSKVGKDLYFQTLWAPFDFSTAVLLMIYVLLRFLAHVGNSVDINKWAYQVLSLAGVPLIPRTFAFLDSSQEFSSMMISARKMTIDLIYCWLVIIIFSLGFWASLSKSADGIFTPFKVFGDQVQILFGFTPAVWTTWREYTEVGKVVLFLYLFVAQFVVTTMVIAALSARYSEINAQATEEYHYVQTIQTITKLKSERSTLFFFAEPFNLLGISLYPMSWVLSVRNFILLNRAAMRILQMPILVCIFIYEKTMWKLEVRKKRIEELQIKQLKQHVKTARESVRRKHRPSWVKVNRKLFDRSIQRTSKMDLVAGALESSLPSAEPTSSAPHARITPSSQRLNGQLRQPSHLQDVFAEDYQHGPPAPHSSMNPPMARKRGYSSTSSVLQNLNSLRLSPTMSYGDVLRRMSRDDEEGMESDVMLDFLQELDERSQRIEQMLEKLAAAEVKAS